MKKNLLILTLALLVALPVFGLAAEATTPEKTEVEATETTQTTPAAPFGGQKGRRWNQAAPETTAPQTGYVDADDDGFCDNCGNEPGKNTDAPNYVDENEDGICDLFGTDAQGQGARNMQAMRGRMQAMRDQMQQMRGRMQNAQGRGQQDQDNFQGRGQGMKGRNQQAQGQGSQGNVQGRNHADADNDGVCDNFGADTQRNFGPGRNRR